MTTGTEEPQKLQPAIISYVKDLPNLCSLAGLACTILAIYFSILGIYYAAMIGMIWAVALHLTEGPWVRPSIIVHDPSIEIANQEQEGTEVVEEELLDGAYRVISMATTNQMIMPVDISGEEFIDPPPEIAEAFAETFAQARVRVAKEEAERAAETGDAQNPLTQDAVLKLVSELLQDPGTLSRERATELGMDLVSTFDKILNRHEDEGENL